MAVTDSMCAVAGLFIWAAAMIRSQPVAALRQLERRPGGVPPLMREALSLKPAGRQRYPDRVQNLEPGWAPRLDLAADLLDALPAVEQMIVFRLACRQAPGDLAKTVGVSVAEVQARQLTALAQAAALIPPGLMVALR